MRSQPATAGAIAAVITAAAASTIAVVLAVTLLVEHLFSLRLAETQQFEARALMAGNAGGQALSVAREHKTDALPAPSNGESPSADIPVRKQVKSVEVVGIRDAVVVYRDSHGNVLFRTDPIANVTLVVKNVDLPQVTIRDSSETPVERVQIDGVAPHLPLGCEPVDGGPGESPLNRVPSRCLALIGTLPHEAHASRN